MVVASSLKEALNPSAQVTCVDLGGHGLGDAGAKQLAQVLNSWPTAVTELRLPGNEISDEGVKALAESLSRPSPLTTVVLCNNHVSESGQEALAAAFEANQTLSAIYTNLRSNGYSKHLTRGEIRADNGNAHWID